jgi:hypothetical protein
MSCSSLTLFACGHILVGRGYPSRYTSNAVSSSSYWRNECIREFFFIQKPELEGTTTFHVSRTFPSYHFTVFLFEILQHYKKKPLAPPPYNAQRTCWDRHHSAHDQKRAIVPARSYSFQNREPSLRRKESRLFTPTALPTIREELIRHPDCLTPGIPSWDPPI